MKTEQLTKKDVQEIVQKEIKKTDKKISKLDNRMDTLETKMGNMFEKFTTVILEAIDEKSKKIVKETHENTLRIIEIERDRYGVLFEMNADHDGKIRSLDRRVKVLETL